MHDATKGSKMFSWLQLFIGNPSQSYGASPAVWNHKVMRVTRHPTQANMLRLNSSQTGRYAMNLSQSHGRLS